MLSARFDLRERTLPPLVKIAFDQGPIQLLIGGVIGMEIVVLLREKGVRPT